jgi:serine/threonine protein kinase
MIIIPIDISNIPLADLQIENENSDIDEEEEEEEGSEGKNKKHSDILSICQTKVDPEEMTAKLLQYLLHDAGACESSSDEDEEEDDEEEDDYSVDIEEVLFSLQNNYKFQKRIHSHGNVATYHAIDNKNKDVCVKIVILHSPTTRIPVEVRMMEIILRSENLHHHHHLAKLQGYFKGDNFYVVVSRLEIESSLKHIFKDEPRILSFTHQLIKAVLALHNLNIIHRDIKPSNVLYDYEKDKVVLCDFDLSSMERSLGHHIIVGTDSFIAPEILAHASPYDRTIDLWSLGATLGSLLFKTREIDLDENSVFRWRKLVTDKCVIAITDKPTAISSLLVRIFIGLTETLPKDRMTLQSALCLLQTVL